MNWVRDLNERLINIDRWDILDYQIIYDKNTGNAVAIKAYLIREDEHLLLGFRKYSCAEEMLERIVKGVSVYFEDLKDILFYYLYDELTKMYGPIPNGEGYEKASEERYSTIKKLIGVRFVGE